MSNTLIRLTWKDGELEVTEECELLSDANKLFTLTGIQVDSNILNQFAQNGYVLFEDDAGIFMLPPERIIKIEIL